MIVKETANIINSKTSDLTISMGCKSREVREKSSTQNWEVKKFHFIQTQQLVISQ